MDLQEVPSFGVTALFQVVGVAIAFPVVDATPHHWQVCQVWYSDLLSRHPWL